MGQQVHINQSDNALKQHFTAHLIRDLRALERILKDGSIETGVKRIGAEQEFCLIDYSLRPSMKAMEVLDKIDDPHFTTELARFNLEANMDPYLFKGRCFTQLETDMVRILTKANQVAHSVGSKIILAGILPTIRKSDIVLENMTPLERYHLLNDAILESRASDFRFNIRGVDELITRHDNVLFESCNTSFQVHFQVEADQTIHAYNWAHAISGPVLAAATNSPIFFGKRLWNETRIALFHQSADTRKSVSHLRKERSRVTFGYGWETKSALEMFREIVGRYRVLLPIQIEEDPIKLLDEGKFPKLTALSVHNGTIYRWNRLCYGLTEGVPHLRIELRYLPAGPTIVDEVANAAFWTGLMNGMPKKYEDIHLKMDFDDAKRNFISAAKFGLQSQFSWMKKNCIPAQDLILNELIPIAIEGLRSAGVDELDIKKYMGIIEERVKCRQTGSRWMLDSYNRLKNGVSTDEAVVALTEGIYKRQKIGSPVHQWSELDPSEGGGWENKYRHVEQVMSTDLITVQEDDILELARNVMLWSHIHHLPVEDGKGALIGLVSADQLLSVLGDTSPEDLTTMTVGSIMVRDVISVSPATRTIQAYHLMRDKEVGSLPVVEDGKLVGIITLKHFVRLIGFFFEEMGKGGSE